MPELWRRNPRTSRVRDSVPRLLTSLRAMWLLDVRDHPDERKHGCGQNDQGKKLRAKTRVLHKHRTVRSPHVKTPGTDSYDRNHCGFRLTQIPYVVGVLIMCIATLSCSPTP